MKEGRGGAERKINRQPIRKYDPDSGSILSVYSIFKTIQGEGPFAGTPAVFIRLEGCNLRCPACDTEYHVPDESRVCLEVDSVVEAVKVVSENTALVVVTGGEPFRQNLRELIGRLLDEGCYVQIETNGTLPFVGAEKFHSPFKYKFSYPIGARKGVYVVCSPKTEKIHPSIESIACAFKYIVQAGNVSHEDGLPVQALENPCRSRVHRTKRKDVVVYVLPMDAQNSEQNKENIKAAVNSSQKHGHVLQLQIHKIIGVS